MAVFSTLSALNRFKQISRLIRNVGSKGRHYHYQEGLLDDRQFPLRASVYPWRKWKDFLHFYTMLGVIPLTIITTWANIVYGPAHLTEIPEGYEPKAYEYYRSPITRFMARYVIKDKRIDYEGFVHLMNEDSEIMIMRQIEKMVKDFMKYRNDYQSWYYRPIDGYNYRFDREEWKYLRDHVTGQKDYIGEKDPMFSSMDNPSN